MSASGRRGRVKRLRRPFAFEQERTQRLAACEIVRDVVGASGEEFDWPAKDAAVDAILRHPTAGDQQILDFLRWFETDANPMP